MNTLIVICLAIIVPILVYSANSLPVAYDYSLAKVSFLEADGADGLLISAIKYTARRYLTAGHASHRERTG